MADLPNLPGNAGPPQIPGGAEYVAAARRRAGGAPPGAATPPSQGGPGRRPPRRRSGFGRVRAVHVVVAGLVALIGLSRAGREDEQAVSTITSKLPVVGTPRASSGDAAAGPAPTVPSAAVYRAGPGDVAGHARTIIELGVRGGRIRWVAASRLGTTCSDGTSSSGLLLYDDEGTASGSGRTLRYRTDTMRLTFRPGAQRGTLRYERQGLELRCASPTLTFRAARAGEPLLAQGLLDADHRAADRFR